MLLTAGQGLVFIQFWEFFNLFSYIALQNSLQGTSVSLSLSSTVWSTCNWLIAFAWEMLKKKFIFERNLSWFLFELELELLCTQKPFCCAIGTWQTIPSQKCLKTCLQVCPLLTTCKCVARTLYTKRLTVFFSAAAGCNWPYSLLVSNPVICTFMFLLVCNWDLDVG